jgi:hypothetical protein
MKKKTTTTKTKSVPKVVWTPGPPKTSHQGAGRNSLPKKGHKAYRGQGR